LEVESQILIIWRVEISRREGYPADYFTPGTHMSYMFDTKDAMNILTIMRVVAFQTILVS